MCLFNAVKACFLGVWIFSATTIKNIYIINYVSMWRFSRQRRSPPFLCWIQIASKKFTVDACTPFTPYQSFINGNGAPDCHYFQLNLLTWQNMRWLFWWSSAGCSLCVSLQIKNASTTREQNIIICFFLPLSALILVTGRVTGRSNYIKLLDAVECELTNLHVDQKSSPLIVRCCVFAQLTFSLVMNSSNSSDVQDGETFLKCKEVLRRAPKVFSYTQSVWFTCVTLLFCSCFKDKTMQSMKGRNTSSCSMSTWQHIRTELSVISWWMFVSWIVRETFFYECFELFMWNHPLQLQFDSLLSTSFFDFPPEPENSQKHYMWFLLFF